MWKPVERNPRRALCECVKRGTTRTPTPHRSGGQFSSYPGHWCGPRRSGRAYRSPSGGCSHVERGTCPGLPVAPFCQHRRWWTSCLQLGSWPASGGTHSFFQWGRRCRWWLCRCLRLAGGRGGPHSPWWWGGGGLGWGRWKIRRLHRKRPSRQSFGPPVRSLGGCVAPGRGWSHWCCMKTAWPLTKEMKVVLLCSARRS